MPDIRVKAKGAATLPATPDLFKIDWTAGVDSQGQLTVEPLGAGDKADGVLRPKVGSLPRMGRVAWEAADVVLDGACASGDNLAEKAAGGGRLVKSGGASGKARALGAATKAGDVIKAAVF